MSASSRSLSKYLARRQAAADYVRQADMPGHDVHAEQDWGKSYRSRPGSDDWKAHCSCGWSSSTWHHGKTEALASAARHIKAVQP